MQPIEVPTQSDPTDRERFLAVVEQWGTQTVQVTSDGLTIEIVSAKEPAK